MAFASAITERNLIFGSKKITRGTYTSSASGTGGDIDTGLDSCEQIFLQPGGSAVKASAPVVNETLPAVGSAITIVTVADEVGTWMAIGK